MKNKKENIKLMASACLSGENCRYDGSTKTSGNLAEMKASGRLVTVCPEMLAGLGVPRPASEIRGGDGSDVLAGRARIVNDRGEDITKSFIAGCRKALALALKHGIRLAVLKEKSAACASKIIYDGSFSGRQVPGRGVLRVLLEEAGIEVINEEEFLNRKSTAHE